jgi:hypothetical protein
MREKADWRGFVGFVSAFWELHIFSWQDNKVGERDYPPVIGRNDQRSQDLRNNWLPMPAPGSLEGRLLQQAKTGGTSGE